MYLIALYLHNEVLKTARILMCVWLLAHSPGLPGLQSRGQTSARPSNLPRFSTLATAAVWR